MMHKKRHFNLIGLGFNLIAVVLIFVAIAEGGNKLFYFTCSLLMFIAVGFYIAFLAEIRKS